MEKRIDELEFKPNYIDLEKDYGVKGDGVTDNTAALLKFRTDYAGSKGLVRALLPDGQINYRDNRWIYGITNGLEIDSKGITTLKVTYVDPNGSFNDVRHRPLFTGELFQNNVLNPLDDGLKIYEAPTNFAPVQAGMQEITLLPTTNSKTNTAAPSINDNTRFFAGAYILLFFYNQTGEGYPPGARYWERIQVKSVDIPNSKLILETPIQNTYTNDVWTVDRSTEDGLDIGIPSLISLDRPQNTQSKYIKISNCRATTTSGGINGYWAITADVLELISIKNPLNPYWPQENTTRVTYIDCEFESSENDKLCGLVEDIRTTVVHDINNGGGCKRHILDGCSTGDSLQLTTPYLDLRNGTARANSIGSGRPDPYAGALDEYASGMPREEVSLTNYRFTNGKDWKGDQGYINIGVHYSTTIKAVDATTKAIILPFVDNRPGFPGYNSNNPTYFTYSSREVSSFKEGLSLFNANGSNGGKITKIYRDPSKPTTSRNADIWIEGTWSTVPTVGEIWKWTPIKTILDMGGNRKIGNFSNNVPLWSMACKRWEGNTMRGEMKQTIINFDQLNKGVKIRYNQDDSTTPIDQTNTLIEYNAFIVGIDVNVTSPNAIGDNNFIQITTNANSQADDPNTPRVELGRINLNKPGLRRITQLGTQGLRVGDTILPDTILTAGFVRELELFHPGILTNPGKGSITITWQTF